MRCGALQRFWRRQAGSRVLQFCSDKLALILFTFGFTFYRIPISWIRFFFLFGRKSVIFTLIICFLEKKGESVLLDLGGLHLPGFISQNETVSKDGFSPW